MTSLTELEQQLRAILGDSAKFWPKTGASLDDYYEVYLWSEVTAVAVTNGWQVTFVNAGASNDEFMFRRGPGLFSSATPYTYAVLCKGSSCGELHIGIKVRGLSQILHEFDVVLLDAGHAQSARSAGNEPSSPAVRLHMEAKFYTADLSLGIGRALVGLGRDCLGIHPFLVSKGAGSNSVRALVKFHGGTHVHNAFPGSGGLDYLHRCIETALYRWT